MADTYFYNLKQLIVSINVLVQLYWFKFNSYTTPNTYQRNNILHLF